MTVWTWIIVFWQDPPLELAGAEPTNRFFCYTTEELGSQIPPTLSVGQWSRSTRTKTRMMQLDREAGAIVDGEYCLLMKGAEGKSAADGRLQFRRCFP